MNFIPESPETYQGNQVIINSDRLIFNAKNDATLIYADKAIGFSTNGNFHFDTSNVEDTKFIVNSPNIYLGLTYDGFVTHVLSGFNIPVVNIQGGFVDEKTMSYDGNINLYYDHFESPCGNTFPCKHCDEANEYITVDMVIDACKKLL